MPIKPLNSIAGFSVGEFPSTTIIDANGNVSTGNFSASALANLGNVANVKVFGGTEGQVLRTDGNGNLTFTTTASSNSIFNGTSNVSIPANNGNVNIVSGGNTTLVVTATGANVTGTGNFSGNVSVGGLLTDNIYHANGAPFDLQQAAGTNTQIQFNMGNNFAASANFTFDDATQVLTVNGNGAFGNVYANSGTIGASLLTGTLTTAAQPNVTSVGTLTGLGVNGNITAANITANTGVFTGNGSGLTNLAGANVTGQVGNALVAGTVYTNAQPNITSVGTLTGLTVGNATANTVFGNGTITATGNITAANFSTGNGAGGNITGANLVSANFFTGTLTTAAQPNITSVGNLTSLDVTGNLTSGNANLGNVATANFFFGAGNNLSNIQGANVTGQVGNALVAGTVYTNAQPNITSVGTLTSLAVTGNLSSGNANLGNLAIANFVQGTLTTAAQPNITSVGTLTDLTSAGNVNFTTASNVALGSNANVHLTGGAAGQVLQTDGAGNLSWVTTASSNSIFNGTSNVSIPSANGNINLVSGGNTTMVLTATGANIAGYANITGDLTANNANLSNLAVTGNVSAGNVVTNNIVGANTGVTITATGTNQNINLVPTGSGKVNVGEFIISNVATPVSASDAATKQYVDDVAQGLHVHASCNAATTGTLATISGGTVTYDNGTAGVGATLTTTGSYTTIDGVTLVNGDRILVKNEVAPANNGIYVRTSATVLTRATDFNTPAEIAGGDFTFVTAGTQYNSTGWVQIDEVTTIGTDPIVWEQFSGAGTYTAGTGLTLTGSVFSITNTTVTAASYGGGDAVATFTVNAQGQLTAAADVAITANAANLSGSTLASGITTSSLTSVGTLGSLAVTGNVTSGNVYANSGTIGAANLTGTLTTAAQPNVTSVGNLSNLTIAANGNITMSGAGSSLSGANLVSATLFTGTLTTNAQPNITSVGSLANLTVTGNVGAGNISATTANLTTANVTGNVIIGNSTTSAATLTTTANTAGQIIAQFPVSGVTGVEFLVKGVDAAGAKYSVSTVQVVTDGANADYTIFGGVTLGGFTGSLSAGVAGGNLSLQVTPSTANSTVWTTQYRFI